MHMLMNPAGLHVLKCGLSLHFHPYFMNANSEGICTDGHEPPFLDNAITHKAYVLAYKYGQTRISPNVDVCFLAYLLNLYI